MRPIARQHSRRRERGTALTELAILVPLFVIIFMWAQFFTDLGLVKLKAEEAARYALWEMAVQQPVGGAAASVQDRFKDLASPNVPEFQLARPMGTQSFTAPVTVTVAIADQLGEPFGGSIPQPNNGGGFWGQIASWLARFTGRVVDTMLRRFGLETTSSAQVTDVSMTVQDRAFPGFRFLPLLVRDPGPPRTVTVHASSPRMLVDSWKAWASKYNPSRGDIRNIETSPYESYGSNFPGDDGLPERVVSAWVANAAFFGLGNQLSSATRAFTYIGLRNPLSTDTHAGSTNSRDASGPITMLPGRTDSRGWTVSSGRPIKRYGGDFSSNYNSKETRSVGLSGEDHPRFTVPGRIYSTEWTGSGGTMTPVQSWHSRNPYTMMFDCRDVFYMGSVRGGGLGANTSRHKMDFASYQTRMYRSCPRGSNQW